MRSVGLKAVWSWITMPLLCCWHWIHFLKEKQLQNPKNFRLRRAVSCEQNFIDFPYCPPQARKILGYNFPPMGETLGGEFFTSPPWGGPWGGSSKKLPPHAMGGNNDPCRIQHWIRHIQLMTCMLDAGAVCRHSHSISLPRSSVFLDKTGSPWLSAKPKL